MRFFILFCLVAAVTADFNEFQKKHGKKYKSKAHAAVAEGHFKRHQDQVQKHNEDFAAGKVSFKIALNKFADQNGTEVISQLCRTVVPPTLRSLPASPAIQGITTFPAGAASKDWTSTMQPVVCQQKCGCCYAFAAIAQVESLYKRNSYNFVMSQQFLVDCSKSNFGCKGGWPTLAMETILANGTRTNASYPYTAAQAAACPATLPAAITPKLPTTVVQYNLYGNETQLKNVVSQEGPVAVVIYASSLFTKYSSGVFYDPACPSGTTAAICNQVNHAVVVVGYGTDAVYGDYWLVRNSWSPSWGNAGYVKMARNRSNNCNTACYAMYMKK